MVIFKRDTMTLFSTNCQLNFKPINIPPFMTDLELGLDTKHIFWLLRGANEEKMTAGLEIQVNSVKDSFQINHFPLIAPSKQ